MQDFWSKPFGLLQVLTRAGKRKDKRGSDNKAGARGKADPSPYRR
jgi:hypothetical protein